MRKQPGAALKSKKPWTFSRFIGEFGGWVFIIPSFILFAFFVWEPMLYGVVLSFSKLRAFDIVGFAGLENYRYVFSHPYFAKALLNTVQYAFWSLIKYCFRIGFHSSLRIIADYRGNYPQ